MVPAGPMTESISDTGLWVAVHRAHETDRADGWFRDPFARRLPESGTSRSQRRGDSPGRDA
jgi:O-methyltransferase involved in polyketide biosynthesis